MSDLPGFTKERLTARGVVAGKEETEKRLDRVEKTVELLSAEVDELRKEVKKKKG